MDNKLNFELSRLRIEVDYLNKNDLSLPGQNLVIFSIPEDIIGVLSELDMPTIHKVLEVVLFYSSFTGRSVEIEDILWAYLESEVDAEMLQKAISIVVRQNIVEQIEEALEDVYEELNSILFFGWTISLGSLNFYENYDIYIRSEREESKWKR